MNVSPTPRRRVVRTAIQVSLAVLAAVPAAVALTPLDARAAAGAVGIAGAMTIIISAGWNAYDQAQTRSTQPLIDEQGE